MAGAVPLAVQGILDLATVLPVEEVVDLGPADGIAVSEDVRSTRKERIRRFPIVADRAYEATLRAHLERYERYHVGRIGLMSIPECRAAGAHLVVVKDGAYVRESSRGGQSFRDRSLFPRDEQDSILFEESRPSTRIDGSALVVGAKAADGYFHWMTEIVPRLVAGRRDDRARAMPVVMRPTGHEYQRETLRWLGVEPTVVETPIVEIERAIVPTFPIHLKRGGRYSGELVELVREFAGTVAPRHEGETPRRLYVSRRDARHRHVANEDEVEAALTREGFACVTLTGTPVPEQIRMFEQAEVVVAQHGAGLTNLLFARPGTRVVELYPRGFIAPSPFWMLASLAGLDYSMMVCDVVPDSVIPGRGHNNADIVVDVRALLRSVPGPRRRGWRIGRRPARG
ncbi:unannotated protein [freshwater metagenome]|uniref:Unannotated protein n=1 Tax=freshwater metagenome TaxID=449393 RepID=A0A6J7IXV0_9ZZZZ|nr:DUF563 domain-containing protein [Actinomycetota bacterium]